MPATPVFYEGDDDFELLAGLERAGHLPELLVSRRLPSAPVAPGRARTGIDGALADLVSAAESRVHGITLIDRDDRRPGLTFAEVATRLGDRVARAPEAISERVATFDVEAKRGPVRVAIVVAGAPDEEWSGAFPTVRRFAGDDYVLRLTRLERVYGALKNEIEVPHDKAWHKLEAIAALMADNAIPITGSKRLLHLFRAIVGFRAAPATFAKLVVEAVVNAVPAAAEREALFDPLVSDLLVARDALRHA